MVTSLTQAAANIRNINPFDAGCDADAIALALVKVKQRTLPLKISLTSLVRPNTTGPSKCYHWKSWADKQYTFSWAASSTSLETCFGRFRR